MIIRFAVFFIALFVTQCLQADGITVNNQVTHPVTGKVLGEYQNWIYLKGPDGWDRLWPGNRPQWTADGQRIYYFLDVGYDGARSQLWAASLGDWGPVRLSREDYYMGQTSPQISHSGKKLAYHYSTSRASGDFEDIVVIELGNLDGYSNAKVVYRASVDKDITLLGWLGEDRLRILADGSPEDIFTDVPGYDHLP